MLTPSVCIDAVLEGRPLAQAVEVVAECGYSALEFWAWWEKDLDAIVHACQKSQLQVAACCTRFISLTDARQRDAYLQGLSESIDAARRLNCPTLISQVGDALPGVPRSTQRVSIVAGLKQAAPLLEEAGVTLVIEPLNVEVDHPGYFLVQSDEAFDIVDQVGSPRVRVVFDIYHQQISEGNLLSRITRNVDRIGHFHAAGNPGRHELFRGEINYPEIVHAIAATTYSGYLGLEYWPLEDAVAGLRKIAAWFDH